MGAKVFSSAINFTNVTPSDSTLVTCKALYIGTSGNLALAQSDSATAIVFYNVGSGMILPIELKNGRVMSTATTSTNIIALTW